MYLVFYRTGDVFEAEEILLRNGINVEIAPTPVQDKAYCGVCVKLAENDVPTAIASLTDLEFQQVC